MASNAEVLSQEQVTNRADLAVANLTSGGKLEAQVYDKFMQEVENATPVLQGARVIRMESHTGKYPKLAFTGRILKASPGELTALASGDRSAPTPSQVVLNTVEVVGEVDLSDNVIEDNVEKGRLETTLLTMIARRVGCDVEEMGLKGDTTSLDALLALTDGWTKRITSNVVNAASTHVREEILAAAWRSIALKFRQQMRGKYRFAMPDYVAEKWRSITSNRQTVMGDKYLLEGAIPPYAGVPMEPVAHLPTDTTGNPDVGTGLLTPYENLVLGVWRDVRIEKERRPELRGYKIHITARVGFAVEEERAACKINNLRIED